MKQNRFFNSSAQIDFTHIQFRAIASAFLATVIIATVPILAKFGEKELSASALIFHRLWIGAMMLFFWQVFQILPQKLQQYFHNQQSSNLSQPTNFKVEMTKFDLIRTLALILCTGVAYATMQDLWAVSIAHTSLANSAILHNLTPLVTAIIGLLFFQQHLELQFTIGMIVAVAGSLLLGLNDFQIEVSKIHGDAIALGSAVMLALYLLLLDRVRQKFSAVLTVLYCSLVGIPIILIPILVNHERIFPTSLSVWLAVIGLGGTIALGHGLLAYALKWVSPEFIAILMLLEPIITAALSSVIFSENLDFYNLLAFPIILTGMYLAINSPSLLEAKQEKINNREQGTL